MPMEGLKDVLEDILRDLYHAEKQLTRALPKMAKTANSAELKSAFKEHLEVTEGQVQRLEQVFEALGLPVKAKRCAAMEGMVEEGKEVIEQSDEGTPFAIDAALIVAAQKVEHYEMAAYGSARTFAQVLGHEDAANLLQETLDEESEANETLTAIAQRINEQAEQESEGEVGDEETENEDMEMAGAGMGGSKRGSRSAGGNSRSTANGKRGVSNSRTRSNAGGARGGRSSAARSRK